MTKAHNGFLFLLVTGVLSADMLAAVGRPIARPVQAEVLHLPPRNPHAVAGDATCGSTRRFAPRPSLNDELPSARPESVGFSAERLKRIHDVLQRHIAANRISGAVTLVARNGRVVHFEAHGLMDIEMRKPMRKDSLFVLASMTKPVTSVAVAMLMEEGKIRLTDPVSRFIPEFKAMKVAVSSDSGSEIRLAAVERAITIRDLLTHTSGLGSGGAGMRQAAEIPWPIAPGETLAGHVTKWAAVPLDFQPGTRWGYSPHAGFDVLARVVEVASGLPFNDFLQRRVFEPLGMNETFFVVPDHCRDRLASIYDVSNKGLTKANYAVIPLAKTYFSGAIGLVSSAGDYFRFAQMLLNRGQWSGKRLLSPRTVEVYSSNHVGDLFEGQLGRPKGMGFGLAVEVVLDPVQAATFRSDGSFGWDGSYGTHFWVDPKKQLVAVLMIQTSTSVTGEIKQDFETAVMQAITE
jgi:CubicO group peptidase (beta-lactamase class C family)